MQDKYLVPVFSLKRISNTGNCEPSAPGIFLSPHTGFFHSFEIFSDFIPWVVLLICSTLFSSKSNIFNFNFYTTMIKNVQRTKNSTMLRNLTFILFLCIAFQR